MTLFALFIYAQAALSFIILAARWDQARIIMVCMPVMLAAMLYTIYHYTKNISMGQTCFAVLLLLIISSVTLSSFKRGFKNLPIVQKNLKGDRFYGYTPDWVNFWAVNFN